MFLFNPLLLSEIFSKDAILNYILLNTVYIIVILIAYIIASSFWNTHNYKFNKILTLLVFSGCFFLAADFFYAFHFEYKQITNTFLSYLFNIIYFLSILLVCFSFYIYCIYELKLKITKKKWLVGLSIIPFIVSSVLLFTTPIHGLIFNVNNGVYERGKFLFTFQFINYSYLIISSIIALIKLLSEKKQIVRRTVMIAFPYPIIIGSLCEYILGYNFDGAGLTISISALFIQGLIFAYTEAIDKYVKSKEEAEKSNLESKKDMMILDRFIGDFDTILLVNIKDDKISPVFFRKGLSPFVYAASRRGYTFFINYIIDKYVINNNEDLRKSCTKQNVIHELNNNPSFILTIFVKANKKNQYYQVKYAFDENKENLIFGLRCIDQLIKEEKRREYFISELSNDYDGVFYYNILTTREEVIRAKGLLTKLDLESDNLFVHDKRMDLISKTMQPSFRDDFIAFTSKKAIFNSLSLQEQVTFPFIGLNNQHYLFIIRAITQEKGVFWAILGIKNVEDAVESENKKVQQLAIISGLTADYDCIFYINPNDAKFICYKESSYFSKFVDLKFTDQFDFLINELAEKVVARDDQYRFLKETTRMHVVPIIKKDKVFTINFKTIENLYFQAKFVGYFDDAGNLVAVLFGLFSIDESMKKEIKQQELLEKTVQERTRELQEKNNALNKTNENIIELLGNVVEGRDKESGEHIQRVKGFTYILASQVMDDLKEYHLGIDDVNLITSASALHDVGKIMVSDTILLKPGRLTPEEFNIMKTHTTSGVEILNKASKDFSPAYLKTCLDICHYHHEKWDGRGYPEGLKGDEIPISAQIVSIADIYDALITKRVYKDAYSLEQAYEMIINGECGQFSPKLLECFRKCKSSFESHAKNKINILTDRKMSNITGSNLSNLKILIVDDDKVNCSITEDILKEAGAIVYVASSGQDAIRLIKEIGTSHIDAVLMDLVMEGMDGFETSRAIRSLDLKGIDTLPILAYTSDTSDASIEKALNAGMNAYLTKPISTTVLTKILLDCMKNQQQKLQTRLKDVVNRSQVDTLTGVYNIAAYSLDVDELSKQIRLQSDYKFALLVCDINNLKKVNDNYGHDVGDIYIKNCSKIMSDVFKNSKVYRVGGDEFVVILKDTDYNNRDILINLLEKNIAYSMLISDYNNGKANFAYGLGVYDYNSDGYEVSLVFKKADEQMYKNKRLMIASGKADL